MYLILRHLYLLTRHEMLQIGLSNLLRLVQGLAVQGLGIEADGRKACSSP